MPSERSIYRKIQEVLEVAKSVKVSSIAELRAHVANQQGDVFKTLQYDSDIDKMVRRVSVVVIRHAVKMCRFLDLVDDGGTLTDTGRAALRKTRFHKVIADQVRLRLHEQGVNLSHLNRLIVGAFRKSPPVLPTVQILWEAEGGDMARGLFTRFLTLLAHCGCAQSSQRKIYLRFDTE
jgi:hypothetical protein